MERKICPHCNRPSYSSLSYTKVWTCAYCEKEFLAVEGEEMGRPVSDGPLGRGLREQSGYEHEGESGRARSG